MTKKSPPTTKRRPAAQAVASKKAADLKAENAAKRPPQRPWLRDLARQMAPLSDDPEPDAPERLSAAHQSQGPPRLLDKADVCRIANATFPTVWAWMRQGAFPRSFAVGGRSMWRSDEVAAWLDQLPRRRLKGDAPLEVGA